MARPPHRRTAAPNRAANAFFQAALKAQQAGDAGKALASAKQALAADPHHAHAMNLIGVVLYLQGGSAEAVTWLRRAIALRRDPSYLLNLGLALQQLGRSEDAIEAYRDTVALQPNNHQAWNNLGNLLGRGHNPERNREAIACYERALQAKPDYASADTNLGYALENNDDLAGAERHYRRALQYAPEFVPALGNLAALLKSAKQPEEALQIYRRALALQPHDAKLIDNTLAVRRQLADWDPAQAPHADDLVAALRATGNNAVAPPLQLLALPEVDAQLQREAAKRFAHSRWAPELSRPPLVPAAQSTAGRRLRIGYLSADFRNHPVTHLVLDVVAAHDRQRVEVFLYAYGPTREDEPRQRLRAAADHFVVVSDIGDAQAAQRIADDGIDILVDLTGYTTHARIGITALRPAPVIASWLGFIGSLGEPRLADYIIGDAIATPPEHAGHFSEALALMPECYQPNLAWQPLPPPPTRASEGLPEQGIVFCSFNQVFKLHPLLWDDWCAILRRVPGSVLWLAPPGSVTAERHLREEAERRGVAGQRVVFATFRPLAEHQARIALADLSLDTWPYNSGTTASDVLRACVPLVTLRGQTFVGRMAASLLHVAGLPELVVADRSAYIELAVGLASDVDRRLQLRQQLQESVPLSPLFQPQRFTTQLEALFVKMHEHAVAGRREMISLVDPAAPTVGPTNRTSPVNP